MVRAHLEYLGNTVELPAGETLVGRSIGCRIRFNDASISRRHLRFIVGEKGLTVEDLSSRNGSLLNGKPFTGALALTEGDELQVGFKKLRVRVFEGQDLALEEETENRGNQWQGKGHQGDDTPPRGTPLPLAKEVSTGQLKMILVNCPRCRAKVPIDAGVCSKCSYKWPSGRPMSITQEFYVESAVERRRNTRHPIEMPLIYSSETLTFDALARDLSRGGMFVATEFLDDLGTTCNVTLLPDGGPALHFSGVVCHVITAASGEAGRPPGFGVQFTTVGQEAQVWLEAFLRTANPVGAVL